MRGDTFVPKRITAKSRANYQFICIAAVAASLLVHYTLWSAAARPPIPHPDFTTAAPSADHVPPPEPAPAPPSNSDSPPSDREAAAPAAASNPGADAPSLETSAKPGCEDGTRAVGENFTPCIDLKTPLWRQLIYVTDTSKVHYMYCGIPKNGCTYHLALQRRIKGEPDYELSRVIHDRDRKNEETLHARHSETIARMLANSSLPKYMVVRNPLRRTLSAYLDKVRPYVDEAQQTVEAFHEWVYEQFPEQPPEGTRWKMNPHWKPQLEFCGFKVRDVQKYFKVFRVEEPEKYVEYLYEFVPDEFLKDGWSGKLNLNFRDYVLGPRKRTGNTDEKFLRYFSKLEVFDHLANVLRNDIRELGYTEDIAKLREDVKKHLDL